MSWRNAALALPASLTAIRQQAEAVTGQIPGVMSAATGRLAALAERAQYRRHPLSDEAAALLGLDLPPSGWRRSPPRRAHCTGCSG